MRGYSKFLDYIKDKFYDEIFRRCTGYIVNHRQSLILEPKDITKATDIEITDLNFINVYIEDKPDEDITFDVIVAPEVSFSYYNKRYKEDDSDSIRIPWLKVTCTGTIGKDDLLNFKIKNIEEYSKHKGHKPLDGDLVPIIPGEKYDEVAEAFLSKYYPEALNQECPIDTDKLVSNMGLKLIYRRINKEATIFGESFFEDTEAEFYDAKNGKAIKEKVEANTIVIDNMSHALFSFGSLSITIIHECLHFYLHKKAFRFARIYNKNLKYISCATSGVMLNISNDDRSRWMEIEANGIAPHVLMTKNKLLGLYHFYLDFESSIDGSFAVYMPKVVFDIANRLHVSVYSVKKRLLEIGIKEVAGCLDYVDGHYVTPYGFKEESLSYNETYTISREDLINALDSDAHLLMALSKGQYRFVENHLVYNDEKYIKTNVDGELELTKEARSHIDECAVKFSIQSDGSIFKDNKSSFVTFCYLCRENLFQDLHFRAKMIAEPKIAIENKEEKDKYDDA